MQMSHKIVYDTDNHILHVFKKARGDDEQPDDMCCEVTGTCAVGDHAYVAYGHSQSVDGRHPGCLVRLNLSEHKVLYTHEDEDERGFFDWITLLTEDRITVYSAPIFLTPKEAAAGMDVEQVIVARGLRSVAAAPIKAQRYSDFGFAYVFTFTLTKFNELVQPLIGTTETRECREGFQCVILSYSDMTLKTFASFMVELWTGEVCKSRFPTEDNRPITTVQQWLDSRYMIGVDPTFTFGAFEYQAKAAYDSSLDLANDLYMQAFKFGIRLAAVPQLAGAWPSKPGVILSVLRALRTYIDEASTRIQRIENANQKEAIMDLGRFLQNVVISREQDFEKG